MSTATRLLTISMRRASAVSGVSEPRPRHCKLCGQTPPCLTQWQAHAFGQRTGSGLPFKAAGGGRAKGPCNPPPANVGGGPWCRQQRLCGVCAHSWVEGTGRIGGALGIPSKNAHHCDGQQWPRHVRGLFPKRERAAAGTWHKVRTPPAWMAVNVGRSSTRPGRGASSAAAALAAGRQVGWMPCRLETLRPHTLHRRRRCALLGTSPCNVPAKCESMWARMVLLSTQPRARVASPQGQPGTGQ